MRHLEIFEKRRNPTLNKKEHVLDVLKQYKGRQDIFVSFTSDVGNLSHPFRADAYTYDDEDSIGAPVAHGLKSKGERHNTKGAKIGINPKSEFHTPLGIYTYPVDYVINHQMEVPYAGGKPYIHVLQARGNILNLSTYDGGQYEADLKKLHKIGWLDETTTEFVITRAAGDARDDGPASKIWNITRIYSDTFVTNEEKQALAFPGASDAENFIYRMIKNNWETKVTGFHVYDPDEITMPKAERALDDLNKEYEDTVVGDQLKRVTAEMVFKAWKHYAEFYHEKIKTPKRKSMVQWAKLLRLLGYDGAVDFEDDGNIHPSEPTQAVFFTKNAIKEIELLHNNKKMRPEPKTQMQIWGDKPAIFKNMVAQGKVSIADMKDYIDQVPIVMKSIDYTTLPHEVQDMLDMNPFRYPIGSVPFTADQLFDHIDEQHSKHYYDPYSVISAIPEKYWEDPNFSGAFMKRLLRDPVQYQRFYKTVLQYKVPDKVLIKYVKTTHPDFIQYLSDENKVELLHAARDHAGKYATLSQYVPNSLLLYRVSLQGISLEKLQNIIRATTKLAPDAMKMNTANEVGLMIRAVNTLTFEQLEHLFHWAESPEADIKFVPEIKYEIADAMHRRFPKEYTERSDLHV
jgi:hypothetical protein